MLFAATWIDLEIIILSEVSQKEKDKYHDITYMWNLKYDTNEPIFKTETDSQTQRTDFWLQRGRWGWRGMDWEFGISRRKLLYIEWINNKVLLYSTGNYIQHPVINHNGKEKRGASLVAQWLRICLPMQGTRVRALVWEDPTCRGATRPVSHNY